MSNGPIFLAGAVTTVLLLGVGFGGGLMPAKKAVQPVPQSHLTAADRLPPARVILPYSAQAASTRTGETAVPPPAPSPQSEARPQVVPAKAVEGKSLASEKDKRVDRLDQRKAEAAERERRRHERKAMREAARAKQQEEQARQEQRPGMMALSAGAEQPRFRGFFGN
jgi:hypothetical protein